MLPETAIDRLFNDYTAIVTNLQAAGEISLKITAADHFRKSLLLAAASHFEHRLCSDVIVFVRERAPGSALIENFVQNKAVSRQYHTWFNWTDANANQFFGLFGAHFRTVMSDRVSDSDQLRMSIRSFLEIGRERNKLVHQDFATFAMEKTLDEVYSLYKSGLTFVNMLPQALRDADRTPN